MVYLGRHQSTVLHRTTSGSTASFSKLTVPRPASRVLDRSVTQYLADSSTRQHRSCQGATNDAQRHLPCPKDSHPGSSSRQARPGQLSLKVRGPFRDLSHGRTTGCRSEDASINCAAVFQRALRGFLRISLLARWVVGSRALPLPG